MRSACGAIVLTRAASARRIEHAAGTCPARAIPFGRRRVRTSRPRRYERPVPPPAANSGCYGNCWNKAERSVAFAASPSIGETLKISCTVRSVELCE